MTSLVARVPALAALLVGSAALPAAAMADTRAGQTAQAQEEGREPDWLLLAVACVTLVVGRTIVHRRGSRTSRKPRP